MGQTAGREEDKRPLMMKETIHPTDGQDQTGNLGFGNPCKENINTLQDKCQKVLSALAEALGVGPDATLERRETPLEDQWGKMYCEAQKAHSAPENLHQQCVNLFEESVTKHFPELPAEAAMDLEAHLRNVQDTILEKLLRWAPVLKEAELLGSLIDCYHRRTFAHLHMVLQHRNSNKTEQAFTVLDWALHTYLSQQLLGHPVLEEKALQDIDLLLLTEWIPHAVNKLLANVQEEVSTSLSRILQNEESDGEEGVSAPEALIRLHVDVIQCINYKITRAKTISQTLMGRVQEICCRELQSFVQRYVNVERKQLQKQATVGTSGVMHCFKTFNNCRELRLYISGIAKEEHFDCVKKLENIEALALKLLLEKPLHLAERSLKRYFKHGQMKDKLVELKREIKDQFSKLPKDMEVQKTVIDEAYQRITYLYLHHLVLCKHRKLEKRWKDIGQRVTDDAEVLHTTFSDLNPSVKQWHLILLKVREVLKYRRCQLDTLKLTISEILRDCPGVSKEHLSAVLRWGGLTRGQTREVLEASLGARSEVNPMTYPEFPTRRRAWYHSLLCGQQ